MAQQAFPVLLPKEGVEAAQASGGLTWRGLKGT